MWTWCEIQLQSQWFYDLISVDIKYMSLLFFWFWGTFEFDREIHNVNEEIFFFSMDPISNFLIETKKIRVVNCIIIKSIVNAGIK